MFSNLHPPVAAAAPHMFSHLVSNTGAMPDQNEAHPHLQLLEDNLPETKITGSVPIITAEVMEALPEADRPTQYGLLASDIAAGPSQSVNPHEILKSRIFYNRIYGGLPNVAVERLRINQADLNTQRMLDLMAVSSVKGGSLPLYLHVVSRILRDMRIKQQSNNSTFDYATFKFLVSREDLKEGQMVPLQQRLETLESFMAGQLTIVDLSCPCVTAEAACSLFNICLGLFLEQRATVGRIVALDEAHKYMTDSCDSQTLTESLLSVIRLQRHLGTRVILSTQEPTISSKLLDLCSTVIVHRFTSPAWFIVLQKHLAGVGTDASDLMSHIVDLKTGEALLFCPSAMVSVSRSHVSDEIVFRRLANSRMKIRVRQRVTADGGRSIMAN
ncbi:hypothetical protein ACHAPO_011561 [Fusarium lateritium]